MPDNKGANTGAESSQEKPNTFTQEQVDSMIESRLRREREKFSDYEDLKEKASKYDEQNDNRDQVEKLTDKVNQLTNELKARDDAEKIRVIRETVAKNTGIPANLLTGNDEDSCKEQAEAIKAFAKPQSYPTVKDSGEAMETGKASTRDQFKEWFEQSLN